MLLAIPLTLALARAIVRAVAAYACAIEILLKDVYEHPSELSGHDMQHQENKRAHRVQSHE